MRLHTARSFVSTLLFSMLAMASAPGCAATPDAPGESAAESTGEALTVPAYRAYWDYQGVDLDSVTATARTDGYIPVAISAWGTPAAPRYAATFVKRSGPAFHVVRGTGLAAFQTTFNAQTAANFKPSLLSFDGDASNPVWAAVFVATSTGIPYTRSALVSGDWSNSGTIEYWLQKAHAENLIPSTLSIYGTAAAPQYAIVLEPNTAGVRWSAAQSWDSNGYWNYKLNETHAEYQTRWDALVPAGNRVAIADLQGDEHYVALYRDDSVGGVVGRHGLTRAQLDTEVATQKSAGLFPISIAGGGAGANARFAALFAKSDIPLAKTFNSAGTANASDVAIAAIDDAMKGFMSRRDVRQAQLAVVDGKRLVYARGYTNAEANYPTVSATSTFRMASISKVVTGLEIMKLIEQNQLTLDTKVQDVLNLKTATGAAPIAAFGTIRIRDLLTHTFPTLTTATGQARCLLRDADVSQNGANVIGASLPVSETQALAIGVSSANLVYDRPAGGGCYSNFGYALLGRVIEVKRGTSYVSALQSDVFSPLSLTRPHIASSDPFSQPAGEALYREASLFTKPNVNIAGSPEASLPYGGDNFNALAAPGGLSMAAADLGRILAAMNVTTGNPILKNTVSQNGVPTTVSQMVDNHYGFEGSFSNAYGTHAYKGGELPGLQSNVSFVQNGVSYVLFWASDGLDGFTGSDAWWPSWMTLESAIHGVTWSARPDLFPALGLSTL